MTDRRRSVCATALVAVALTLVGLVVAAPAADATSYRYWTYWLGGTGDWAFSSQGAARRPPDGTVEGWRFAVSETAGSSQTPRVASSFDAICGGTTPVDGKKRVGLVLDFGVTADAPGGSTPPDGPVARCVVVPNTATGYDVLVSATTIRTEDGLVCALAGYPRTGCGEPVASPTPSENGTGSGTGASSGGQGSTTGGVDATDPTDRPGGQSPTTGSSSGDGAGPSRDDTKSQQRRDEDQRRDARATPAAAPHVDNTPVDASVALQTPLADPTTAGSPWGVVGGLVAIVVLVVAAFVVRRRRP